jgi:acyl dehydratase
MMRVFTGLDELKAATGTVLGTSGWLEIDQDKVDRFADATGDHQWIHVDTRRAAAGPFGTTIAHGFLTLSLIPYFAAQAYRLDGWRMAVNYGLDRVRFITPVRVGSRLRGVLELVSLQELPGGVQLTVRATVEIEGNDRPAAVAETINRRYL